MISLLRGPWKPLAPLLPFEPLPKPLAAGAPVRSDQAGTERLPLPLPSMPPECIGGFGSNGRPPPE
jgi:hypothetical protein